MLGVAAGLIATLAAVDLSPEVLTQVGLLIAAGGGLGLAIGRRVSPMQLPQTVAALHSVVGLAAVMTSAGSVLAMEAGHATVLHLTTAYLGVLIGGVTFTGELGCAIYISCSQMHPGVDPAYRSQACGTDAKARSSPSSSSPAASPPAQPSCPAATSSTAA
jgi:hypothetical protein